MENVSLVQQLPRNDTLDFPAHPYSEYLRIEVSSLANLNTAETGAGLYVDADFCPLGEPNGIIALGPVAKDELAVENWKRNKALTPDAHDGRYHYFVYIVPNSPQRRQVSNSKNEILGYDLREQRRDICIRFTVPGYNILPSRSDTTRISAKSLSAAMNSR